MQARLEKVAPGGAASYLFRRRLDVRFGFYWHFHPEIELTYIVRSQGKRFVGDSIEDYEPGDVVLVGPNLPHTWESESRGAGRPEALFCQFSPGFLGERLFQAPELALVRKLLLRSRQGISFTGETGRAVAGRLERMDGLPAGARLLALLEILELLSRSREGRTLSSKAFVPSLRTTDAGRIDRVCRFIHEHLTEPLTLSQVARAAPLSVPAFSRFFRRATGKTFVRYVNELRIGLACRALIESDRTIAQIAGDSGFGNLSNFNRQFLALKATSPREFRAHYSR
jgi:AraC-like DNA-binding protein